MWMRVITPTAVDCHLTGVKTSPPFLLWWSMSFFFISRKIRLFLCLTWKGLAQLQRIVTFVFKISARTVRYTTCYWDFFLAAHKTTPKKKQDNHRSRVTVVILPIWYFFGIHDIHLWLMLLVVFSCDAAGSFLLLLLTKFCDHCLHCIVTSTWTLEFHEHTMIFSIIARMINHRASCFPKKAVHSCIWYLHCLWHASAFLPFVKTS